MEAAPLGDQHTAGDKHAAQRKREQYSCSGPGLRWWWTHRAETLSDCGTALLQFNDATGALPSADQASDAAQLVEPDESADPPLYGPGGRATSSLAGEKWKSDLANHSNWKQWENSSAKCSRSPAIPGPHSLQICETAHAMTTQALRQSSRPYIPSLEHCYCCGQHVVQHCQSLSSSNHLGHSRGIFVECCIQPLPGVAAWPP